MRKSVLQLYAPFIALAVVQALLVVSAPSRGPNRTAAAGGTSVASGSAAPIAGGASAAALAGSSTAVPGGATTGGGTAATPGGGSASAPSGTAGGTGAGSVAPGAAVAKGDTSHCVNGRQFALPHFHYAPPCVAKFTGNNGGATYQGVTATSIKVVNFFSAANDQVNAILAPQGLAQTTEQTAAYDAAAKQFIEKHYEFYGRKIDMIEYHSSCPTTPPDIPTCKEEARKVIAMHPFMVAWATPLYSAVFDEFARAGIVSVGGWHFDASIFNTRRPYRYDVLMDGSRSAQVIADYYCKKMVGKPASNSGRVIHPTIGTRGQTRRKLGIVVPDDPADVSSAKTVQSLVTKCENDPSRQPPIYTYESDINRAAEQTAATVAGLINAKVTTVVCMCDPIAPAFLTKGLTSQNYFPEFLMPGLGLLDYDKVGRLYDQQQMVHAFGPSHLANALPEAQQEKSVVAADVGKPLVACGSCGVNWAYFEMVATMLQMAGPNLTPLSVERAVMANPFPAGDANYPTYRFGANDYTAIEDAREVHWSPAAISPIDGNPGAYVPIDGGRRFLVGQWTRDWKVPPPSD